MTYDLRFFMNFLESRELLVRVKREVDPEYELAASLWKLEAAGKAAAFERVKGCSIPVVGGLYQNIERIGLSLGIPEGEQFSNEQLCEMVDRAISRPIPPAPVGQSAVMEAVDEGEEVDLGKLPVPTFFKRDAGPYITAGVGIIKNPKTGALNMGVYRTQVMGKNQIAVHATPGGDLESIYSTAKKAGETLEVAMAIGVEPAVLVAAVSKTPSDMSELDVAGGIKGSPIEVTKCQTVGLVVPANAEVILEGRVDPMREVNEGPIGEFNGYYGSSLTPLTTITAICHRYNPLFHVILAGQANEHFTFLNALLNTPIKLAALKALKARFPNVKDVNLHWTASTGSMGHLFISIAKRRDEEPREIIKEALGLKIQSTTLSTQIKRVVVVDEDIDVHDPDAVEWAISNRTPSDENVMVIPKVLSWHFDYDVEPGQTSVRLGLDATKPLKNPEKFERAVIPGLEKVKLEEHLTG